MRLTAFVWLSLANVRTGHISSIHCNRPSVHTIKGGVSRVVRRCYHHSYYLSATNQTDRQTRVHVHVVAGNWLQLQTQTDQQQLIRGVKMPGRDE